jgi:6-phosphogluconolactonase/glucosamine-6-phosphate isomerase/deaminase
MTEGMPIEVAGADKPRAPRLRGDVVVRRDADGVIDALLADLYIHAQNCVRTFGDFHLAVSGAAELEPVLRRLLYDLNYRDFPWARTRLWLADEVCAPSAEAGSRWAGVRDLVVEQSGIPPEQAHAIDAGAADGAARYAATLREHLEWRAKGHDRLDFVLVTLREDGDVTGVGVGEDDGSGRELCVRCRRGEAEEVRLGATFVSASRCVAVLAAGAGLGPALRGLEERSRKRDGAMLSSIGGELRWYVDHAACAAAGGTAPGRGAGR